MILYQIVMALALVVTLAHQAVRGAKGALAERLGFGPAPNLAPNLAPNPSFGPASGPRLWLHAASVGEVTSARWAVEALLAAKPGLQMLVTTNTATGRERVRSWALPGVTAALAPFDSAGAAARVLDLWEPRALIVVENELWPARLRACDNRGVPVLVIGARMSARSAARWRMLNGLARRTLACIVWLSAQDEASRDRFVALGLPRAAVGPIMALKSLGKTDAGVAPFAPIGARDTVLLAASTHDGEEALILEAFAQQTRFAHLILAPRHPRRGDEVAALLAARGIIAARRSKGQTPAPGAAVYLADTLGEMALWYAMAGATVIGGTFARRGGHTPWEPARQGSAILHGPSVSNFAAPFAALDRSGGALCVADAAGLARALQSLDAPAQARMAAAASEMLAPEGDGTEVLAVLLRSLKG